MRWDVDAVLPTGLAMPGDAGRRFDAVKHKQYDEEAPGRGDVCCRSVDLHCGAWHDQVKDSKEGRRHVFNA